MVNKKEYLLENPEEAIIDFIKFELAQEEIKRRSNIEIVYGKSKRKGTHYSSKCEKR